LIINQLLTGGNSNFFLIGQFAMLFHINKRIALKN
jgi:hypothetical protein